jgi:hypothetical protein
VPLGAEQRRAAVALLAELLVETARKREGVVSSGGFDSVMDGASGGVAPLPDKRAKARKAA